MREGRGEEKREERIEKGERWEKAEDIPTE